MKDTKKGKPIVWIGYEQRVYYSLLHFLDPPLCGLIVYSSAKTINFAFKFHSKFKFSAVFVTAIDVVISIYTCVCFQYRKMCVLDSYHKF